ncbi:MAG TPA: AMP-binding protein [Jatrophihabitans sp.]
MTRFSAWLAEPRDDRGVHLAQGADQWSYTSYRTLGGSTGSVAAQLTDAGIGSGDTVCLTVPTAYDSLAGMFGAWAADATVCPLPPPSIQPEHEYIEHIAAILAQARPSAILTTAGYEQLIVAAAERASAPAPMLIDRTATSKPPTLTAHAEDATALLQFTSGSTGAPRGVRVSWANLEANYAVTSRWTDRHQDEGVASWLPLYHDMGLIGCLLSAVATQANIWLMSPMQFIRNPARWLECFAPGKASMAAVPPSAFAHLLRRVSAERLKELDLSGLRCVIVGAEPIDPAVLDSFAIAAQAAGFTRQAYVPAYGLAENTLAVSSAGLGGTLDMLLPDWATVGFGTRISILEQAAFGTRGTGEGSGWLLGHGMPAVGDHISIRIINEDGTDLVEDHVGEIAVSGSSVAQGYQSSDLESSARFVEGDLLTGDAGFIHSGQLFVVGRMGDSLQLNGRNIYVEDLDAKVAAAAELPHDRVTIVSTRDRAGVGVAVFVEAQPGPWASKVLQRLRAELGPGPSVTIVSGTRGLIRRTSSGKPRRRHMWQLLHSGQLTGASIVEPEGWDQPTAS